MRAIDGVCSLQALWRQQLMLHVPKGTLRESWGRWLVLEVCRTITLPKTPLHQPSCFPLMYCKPLPPKSPVMMTEIQHPCTFTSAV